MKEIKVLNTKEMLSGKIFNVYGTPEEPLFLAKDIAEMIEYNQRSNGQYDTSGMLQMVDEDEIVKIGCALISRKPSLSAGYANRLFLTEDGMYEVLFQSRKPIAKKFKKEVKQILKDIRITGVHISDSATEEQIQYARENKILQMIDDNIRVGKEIKKYGKTLTPDELKMALIYIYDKLPSAKRGHFLKNVITNVNELKTWYRKSDDVLDFNAMTFERYNVVLLYLTEESKKFIARSTGQKIGNMEKKMNNLPVVAPVELEAPVVTLGWDEDFRVSTTISLSTNPKKPSRYARFNCHKLFLSIGLYSDTETPCVYVSEGNSYKKIGKITMDNSFVEICGIRITFDFNTNEVVILKQVILTK